MTAPSCLQKHEHETEEEREFCDARTYDALSVLKMSQVDFQGPHKIPHFHMPGRVEKRGALEVVVFTEEEIVPWQLEEDNLDDTDEL